MTVKRNTSGLQKNAQKKRQETFKKVNQAIESLTQSNAVITFNTVAEAAGVSKAWLYKEPAVKQRTEQLRGQQDHPSKPTRSTSASEKSLRALNQTLRQQLKRVERENRELRRQNEVLGGCQLQVRTLEKHIQRLEQENRQLKQPATAQQTPIPVEAQLKALDVSLNSTLRKLLTTTPESIIETAIQALAQAQHQGNVLNPGGFLYSAISNCWQPNEAADRSTDLETFNWWWRWAYPQGLVKAATQIDGVRQVLTADDEWVAFKKFSTVHPCPDAAS
ncbi:MAG: DUF6262 family protein [Cyanobacteria bacterium P01_A01_bin.17]